MSYANVFNSTHHPLVYTDQTLVQRGDIVLRLREHDGRVVSAEVAKVWQPMYYENQLPIGVALVAANADLDELPAHKSFSHTEDDGSKKDYFSTAIMLDQDQIKNHLSPLFRGGQYVREWLSKKGEIRVRQKTQEQEYPNKMNNEIFRNAVVGMAQNGNPAATFAIGLWQRDAGKMDKAAKCFRASAQQGHAPSWVEIGIMYAENASNTKNLRYAAECFRHAAEAGSALGAYKLAWCHINGHGVTPDDDMALMLLTRAASMDLNCAILDLGIYYRYGHFHNHRTQALAHKSQHRSDPDYEQAFHCFSSLMKQNWPRIDIAKFHLAECHRLGIGVPQIDTNKAKRLYTEASEHGDLGQDEIQQAAYHAGNFERLMEAANLGYPLAAYLLGRMYWNGENGFAADTIRGGDYLYIAAASEHRCAADAKQLLSKAQGNWEFE